MANQRIQTLKVKKNLKQLIKVKKKLIKKKQSKGKKKEREGAIKKVRESKGKNEN